MAQHLIICFYRGINYSNFRKIDFKQKIQISENKGYKKEEQYKVYFELIGAVNRIINNGEEEFIYYCRDLNNTNDWHYKLSNYDNIINGCPLNDIQNNGQIIMLFYNKCL